MIIWTSSEISSGIGNPMKHLLLIEDTFNKILSKVDYGAGIEELNYIAIILGEKFDVYNEVKKYNFKKKTLEFRLKIQHEEYRKASEKEQCTLIFKSILSAIDEIKVFKINNFNYQQLKLDFTKLGADQKWSNRENKDQ